MFIFFIIFAVIWISVFVTIISSIVKMGKATKNAGRTVRSRQSGGRAYNEAYRQLTARNTSGSTSGRVSSATAQRNEKISDANAKKAQKQLELGKSGRKGYDDYSKQTKRNSGSASRSVTGYDRTYVDSSQSKRRQYSHTFDGHEPWDDCLPKEKDPWDKDFYAGRG